MSEVGVVGPVEIAVIAFPGSQFNAAVAPALADLVDAGTVSILDVVVVTRTQEGEVVALEITDLEVDPFADVDGEVTGILSEEDAIEIGARLDPGSTAAIIVWENTWARRVVAAIRAAGGQLVAHDRIDAETVNRVLADTDA